VRMEMSPIPKTAPFADEEIDLLNRVVGTATPVQRAWLAGFLAGLDASGGTPAVHPAAPDPPPCGPGDLYSDVAAGDPLCRWIQAAVQEGLVSACDEGNDTFCRNAPVRRDQLAAILVSAFSGTIPESTP